MTDGGMKKQDRQAAVLLSFGTVLECFDLILYLHIAFLIDDLFFPKTDPLLAKVFAAAAFCSTFILRPFGALLIGWIGDYIGRKSTIIITTSIMCVSCITMANAPTYAEIGITASIIVIMCRILQGFSSLGEMVGASLYLTETLKPPYKNVACGMIGISSQIGSFLALSVGYFAVSIGSNWRLAFWFGAIIGVIGIVARTKLRETPEFVDYKLRMKIKAKLNQQNPNLIKNSSVYKEKMDKKAFLSCILTGLILPLGFYVPYTYTSGFMKNSLNMIPEAVMSHNMKVSITVILLLLLLLQVVKKVHPLKITKISMYVFALFLGFIPYWFNNISNLFSLFLLQLVASLPFFSVFLAFMMSIWFKHFPIAKRFIAVGTAFAISTALGYVVTSFGLIPLTIYFGHYALLFIYVPIVIGVFYGMNYLEKLERKKGSYPNYPEENPVNIQDTAFESGKYNYELGDEYKPFKSDCEYSTRLLNRLNNLSQ